jgi:hypothetical protein
MARLTAAQRRNLPRSEFGWPERREYPLDTKKRIRNAPARLSASYHMGHVSRAQALKIHRRIAAAGRRKGIQVAPFAGEENPLADLAGGVIFTLVLAGLGYLIWTKTNPAASGAATSAVTGAAPTVNSA